MMRIKIEFFNEQIIDAISAEIYQVSVRHNGKGEILYIKFELLEAVDDMADRKRREKELIQEKNPILQSGISAFLKNS
ncbi:hypothetical protein IMSAGC002_03322 [Lachnospiraceae bacterium]|nr:hypothetical protein IMSAGC002_03322 [Lachnospiraceae bacterium]